MNFDVLFDSCRSSYTFVQIVNTGGSRRAFTAVTALLVLAAAVLIGSRHRLDRRVWMSGLGGVLMLWLVAFQWFNPSYTIDVRTVGPSVVTGIVRDFVPMPFEGHAEERFCVEKVCFHYSDYMHTGGFNNTASHGGPIRPGLPVRVTYAASAKDNVILKLELQE